MKNKNNANSRSHKAFVNTISSLLFYFLTFFANFIYRTLFINVLTVQFLGVQSVFMNVMSFLSLAELGIGSAITFSLYKPIARNEKGKILALLKFYKKIYTGISITVLLLGLLFTPFISILFQSPPDINEPLSIIFILYVINTAISYTYVHKHALLQADQNGFIITFWTNLFLILRNIIQSIWLVISATFIPTLIIQILFTLITNIVISHLAQKRYPYLKGSADSPELEAKEKSDLNIKIRSMLLYKIAAYVVNSTDNLLISRFIGVAAVGLYSNYNMLFVAAISIINSVSTALTPSIGNQAEMQTSYKIERTFNTIFFMFFWLSSLITICFSVLMNPFIIIWIGDSYLLPNTTVFFLLVNFYLSLMRRFMISYRNAFGIYQIARLAPVWEALVNLVFSLFLLNYFGVAGVVIGTIISKVTTGVWIEPYLLYKYYFKKSMTKYWCKYLVYFTTTLVLSLIMVVIRNFFYNKTLFSLILIAVIVFILSNLVIVFLFHKTIEFKETTLYIKSIFLRFIKK